MNSLSAEQLNLILGTSIGLALICSIIVIVFYSKMKHASVHNAEKIKSLSDGLNSKQAELNKMDIEVSKVKSELKAAQTIIEARNLDIAELEGKIQVLKSENNKLLKAASDDITVNIKADQANVPVERKKRPYFKRKNNAGPTTSNPKVGKGKQ
jgi:peptidoglycan hydrolase CwlO-like protein